MRWILIYPLNLYPVWYWPMSTNVFSKEASFMHTNFSFCTILLWVINSLFIFWVFLVMLIRVRTFEVHDLNPDHQIKAQIHFQAQCSSLLQKNCLKGWKFLQAPLPTYHDGQIVNNNKMVDDVTGGRGWGSAEHPQDRGRLGRPRPGTEISTYNEDEWVKTFLWEKWLLGDVKRK